MSRMSMTATQGKRKKAQVAAQMAASRDEQPQQLVTSIAASVSGPVQQEYEQGSPIHGLVQTDAGDPQATPSLHALQWRAAVISALMSEPETSLKRLSANSGLFWLDAAGVRNSHEAAGSMYTGKLEFGRMPVAPAGEVERKARVLTIFMRNNRPNPVLLTELLCLPDSGHFQWYYASGLVPIHESKDKGSGDGRRQAGDGEIREMIDERYRVLNQEALPLRVEANATVSIAVRFHPTFEPGFYDQWLLFRFEVARQYLSDLFSFTTQHAVLGLVVSASCLSNEDASVLFNAEARPFVPGWLRSLFDNEAVQSAGTKIPGSTGSEAPRPQENPRLLCSCCLEEVWGPGTWADKPQRAKANWDGDVHTLPCGHWYHSRCLHRILSPPPPFSRPRNAFGQEFLQCMSSECRECLGGEALEDLCRCTTQALVRRNKASINTDDKLFVTVARGGQISSASSCLSGEIDRWQQQMLALLDAEEEQIENDLHKYDMFEVNRTPGKGVLDADGRPRLKSAMSSTFLDLEVPGLLEKRPSVIYGDAVRIRFTAFCEAVLPFEYVGFVHSIKRTTVRLSIPQAVGELLVRRAISYLQSLRLSLKKSRDHRALAALDASVLPKQRRDERWTQPLWAHVRFSSVKYQAAFTRLRAAVDSLPRQPFLLPLVFPGHHPSARQIPSANGSLCQDDALKSATCPSGQEPAQSDRLGIDTEDVQRCLSATLNSEQCLAIDRMLTCSVSRDNALLVFGPPGTGKTLTLVEGVLLALALGGPATRVLCCAPSDSAADVIVQRLLIRAVTFDLDPKDGRSPGQTPYYMPWRGSMGTAATLDTVQRASALDAKDGVNYNTNARQGQWILRLNPYTREIETVRAEVVPVSAELDSKSQRFVTPSREELEAVPVVVTTCASSSLLLERELKVGHFDYIVVDEAAQALEPETLMALALKGQNTRVVLAGDWKQLGPVVRSRCSDSLGLGKSLLQRLASYSMTHSSASSQQHSGPSLVRLVQNYRSHEELLQLPSALFYDNSLVAAADTASTHDLLGVACKIVEPCQAKDCITVEGDLGQDAAREQQDEGAEAGECAVVAAESVLLDDVTEFVAEPVDPWSTGAEGVVSKSTPLLFFGVQGRDMSEDDTASFYNPVEAAAVRTLIQRLLAGQHGICTNDIGVIAPYRKQVQKIRQLLRNENLNAVRVGTVDDYQGQEERIIVISTTLSNTERLAKESEHSLGFLSNERRFNVAITRASSLCIIVGNPFLMLARPHWKTLLQHCVDRRGYAGCAGPLQYKDSGGSDEEAYDEDSQLDALNQLASEYLLGAGNAPLTDFQSMEACYRDELEFRVLL